MRYAVREIRMRPRWNFTDCVNRLAKPRKNLPYRDMFTPSEITGLISGRSLKSFFTNIATLLMICRGITMWGHRCQTCMRAPTCATEIKYIGRLRFGMDMVPAMGVPVERMYDVLPPHVETPSPSSDTAPVYNNLVTTKSGPFKEVRAGCAGTIIAPSGETPSVFLGRRLGSTSSESCEMPKSAPHQPNPTRPPARPPTASRPL